MRSTKLRARLTSPFLAAALLLSAGTASAQAIVVPSQPRLPDISVVAEELGGLAAVEIDSDQRAAEVFIDFARAGRAPLVVGGLAPGQRTITVRKDGYYDQSLALNLAPNTRTKVKVYLERRIGFLSVTSSTPGVRVAIGDERYAPGILALPVGPYRIRLEAFGYTPREFSVYVPERLVVGISAELEAAPFVASDFSLGRGRFNPSNAGLRGRAALRFRVSAPGYARAELRDRAGLLLRSWSLGPFDDWDQELVWDGLDEAGARLPDGSYSLRVDARAAEGVESTRDSFEFEAPIIVDSKPVIVPSGSAYAPPGSLLVPDAFRTPESGFSLRVGAVFKGDASGLTDGGTELGAELRLAGALDLGLAAKAYAGSGAGAVFAGLRYPLAQAGAFGLALAVDGALSSGSADAPSWLRATLPLGFGSPFLSLSLAPELGWYWEGASAARAGLSASLAASGYSFGGALSARLRSGELPGGPALAEGVELGVELRLLPRGLPIGFRLAGLLDLKPSGPSWSAAFYINGGL